MNTQRLKLQYRKPLKGKINTWYEITYPYLRSNVIKKFSTKQEKAFHLMHSHECGEYQVRVKLRAKRGNALATVNKDQDTTAFKLGKCWKHNSKRKHQFFRDHNPIG